jgi:glycosyltransferase involved in cell wall biosynthesis
MTPETVLFVTPSWTRNGGVATHVMASAAALARRGLDVHVLAARIEDAGPTPGVTLHHGADLFNREVSPQVRVGDAVSGATSLIHLHQFYDPLVAAHLQRSAPVVISAHGYPACTSGVHYFRPGQECMRAHGVGCIPNLVARGCAHVRNPSPLPRDFRGATRALESLTRADLAISYSSTIDRHLAINGVQRRVVVPLFGTLTPVQGSGHEQRRRVVFAGRVVRSKGVDVLVRAARRVDAEFVICGEGFGLDAMRRLVRRLGLEERVSFRGWLGTDQLARELAEASVVAIPSVWPEPFGLVGIEAFAAGRPVVASATGGIADWLTDGQSGLCVPPGDVNALAGALEQLLADPAKQRAMGAAGREMVNERFSVEHHVAALDAAYDSARARWRSLRRDGPEAVATRATRPEQART